MAQACGKAPRVTRTWASGSSVRPTGMEYILGSMGIVIKGSSSSA
jgi:hypothetical protein